MNQPCPHCCSDTCSYHCQLVLHVGDVNIWLALAESLTRSGTLSHPVFDSQAGPRARGPSLTPSHLATRAAPFLLLFAACQTVQFTRTHSRRPHDRANRRCMPLLARACAANQYSSCAPELPLISCFEYVEDVLSLCLLHALRVCDGPPVILMSFSHLGKIMNWNSRLSDEKPNDPLETTTCLQRFLPPNQKPGRIFTDKLKEFEKNVSRFSVQSRLEFASSFRNKRSGRERAAPKREGRYYSCACSKWPWVVRSNAAVTCGICRTEWQMAKQ